MTRLLEPISLSGLHCPNRIFMAPLTRQRAQSPGDVAGELQAVHYSQRASFGLLISEATQISPEGKGYPNTPGIFSAEQVVGWRTVTERVHAAGGRIFAQLWHVGRMSHVHHLPDGQLPVSSMAIRSNAKIGIRHKDGRREQVQTSEPRMLDTHEMLRVVSDFAHATSCAKSAGFDGVEVHAANSYLINQFLSGSLNTRDDAWGGSIENRMRLMLAVVDAAGAIFGHDRVGVRLSPMGSAKELIPHHDDQELMLRAASELGAQSFKMAIIMQDKTTFESFKGGTWQGDVAATAVAARAGAATTAQFDKGVAVYIGDQAGLMAGMSIALSHVAYKNMSDVE